MNNREEYIVCAAIWYKDLKLFKDIPQVRPKNIETGIVITGHRHGHCIWTLLSLTGKRTVTHAEDAAGESKQGFLTSKNRFVDREEGLIIALDQDQVLDISQIRGKQLFSEDLY